MNNFYENIDMDKNFTTYNYVKCPLCNSYNYRTLLSKRGKVLKTNRNIVNSSLKKIICNKCGLVRSGNNWNYKKLQKFYQNEYDEHSSTNENSMFFIKNKSIKRSKYIADWIHHILKNSNISPKSIVDVGCGSGALISELKQILPKSTIFGVETNQKARMIGKKNGIDIFDLSETFPKADLVISYAVIEHTSNPKLFLNYLSSIKNINGFVLTGQPQQDNLSSDIFYQDHLFHFATNHIRDFGKQSGLTQMKKWYGSGPLTNFSFHLFRSSLESFSDSKINFQNSMVRKSISHYQKVFNNVNKILNKLKPREKLSVFGTNLFFDLFYTYTNLSKHKILYGIDDFPTKKQLPFPVITSSEIKDKPINKILLCVNPIYIQQVISKLDSKNYNFLSPFIIN